MTHHGTALCLGARGLLLRGPPGAGKSTLALAAIAHFATGTRFAALVADDRVILDGAGGRLIARPPTTLAGKVEVHFDGVRTVPVLPAVRITLVADLEESAPRMAERATTTLAGVTVPQTTLPARNVAASLAVLAAWLATAS
ncbi:MAG: hypothetical protein AAF318_15235 [Pseudomonadota bacterium]